MPTPDVEVDAGLPEPSFILEQCLFCNLTSPDFDTNVSHMHKNHGLFIPLEIEDGLLALVVDLETLVQYLHLVVSGYKECLFCHTGRQTTQAVQQHMMGKGHCRIDLDGESEFRDFYEEVDNASAASENALDEGDLGESYPKSDDEITQETTTDKQSKRQASFETDGNSLCLSSGKVLSHRSAPPPRRHRPLAETQRVAHRGADHKLPASSSATRPPRDASREATEDATSGPAEAAAAPASSRTLTRFERRAETKNRSTLSVALSRLSANDRAALVHLPGSQQRAVVLRQFKQQDKVVSRERRYWGKSRIQTDTE